MYTSDARQEAYDHLRFLSQHKLITSSVFKHKKAIIDRREAVAVAYRESKAKAKAALAAKVKEAKAAKVKEAKAAKVKEAKEAKAAKVSFGKASKSFNVHEDTPFFDEKIWDFIKTCDLKGKFSTSMRAWSIVAFGKKKAARIPRSISFEIQAAKSLSQTVRDIHFRAREELGLQSEDPLTLVKDSKLSFAISNPVVAKKAKQSFKEGKVNCFMSPIINAFRDRCEGKSKKTVQNINSLLKHAYEFEEKYRTSGVPEADIEHICQTLKISVYFTNILDGHDSIYNPKARFTFYFYNSRLNHVEEGKLVMRGTPEDISEESMQAMIKTMDDEQVAYVIDGSCHDGVPRCVRTLCGAYRLFDDEAKLMDEQYSKYNLSTKAVNACKYPELVEYLQSAYCVNSTPLFLSSETPVCHQDMRKAYGQFKHASTYQGFPGKIHRYVTFNESVDMDFIHENVGIYTGYVTKITNMATVLGMELYKSYTLPSVELLYLSSIGMEFEIVAGAWGSTFDMDFSEEFLESGVYKKWSGRLGMDNETRIYNFPKHEGYNNTFAEDLQYKNPTCQVRFNDGKITLSVPKKIRPTYFHIAAFITSYCRINVLQKMMEIGLEHVCSIQLDGLYLSKVIESVGIFREKPIKPLSNAEAKVNFWYIESEIPGFVDYDGVDSNTALLGSGGTGKTFSVLETNSYHNVVYVSPTRLLGAKMRAKTGCNWTTACKFMGLDTEGRAVRKYIEEYPCVNVVLLDEMTMLSAKAVTAIVEICKQNDIMLLIAGDVEGKQWFQTKNTDGTIAYDLYDITNWKTKMFKKDWRAITSPELQLFKIELRQKMRSVFTDGGQDNCRAIEDWIVNKCTMTGYYDAVKEFKQGDFWIAPTHKMSEKLISEGVVSGYRVKYGGVCSDGEYRDRGEMVSHDVGLSSEKRGSFTTHSCQGLTMTSKLFINIFGSFDYSMIYTAISRAERWEQLKFVWNFL